MQIIIMNKEIEAFLKRLKTVRTKAWEEKITVQAVYNRIARGIYQSVEIDGVKFILEDEK